MSLQTTYQDKATQTDLDKDEKIFNAIAVLCTKIDNMDKEIQKMKGQQHDGKYAELSRSEDLKIPELEGDAGKHRKTQANNLLHAATGRTSSTKRGEKICQYKYEQDIRKTIYTQKTKPHICTTSNKYL
ncbi:hypothetical protein MTR67_026153 [Solanum verrucosum]|uniref:Uncharacterized protein n=1 Tax=Solanum verrucosum TaxID=315347 RepID=A0AAF0TZN1_SOLVR|nr:hypothetical protein MTR67_026153 [Solanum verrucosum]